MNPTADTKEFLATFVVYADTDDKAQRVERRFRAKDEREADGYVECEAARIGNVVAFDVKEV